MAPLLFGTEPGRFELRWPGEAVFGEGSSARVADWARERGLRRPLLLTDAGLAACGHAATLEATLHAAGLAPARFDGVSPNPLLSQVEAAAALWRARACDGLIAFGGGSVIDVAKLLCARLASDRDWPALLREGDAALARPPVPFAAVPTTAGTGSESTTAALVKDDDGRKLVMRSRACRPQWVALDPALTLGLPRAVTAATGFDVAMHALGAATNRATHPVGEALAFDAMRRALAALPAVLAAPDDPAARAEMLLASYLAGVAMSLRGVDGIHGLCTPLEAVVDRPHAHVLAVTCEPVMRFNLATLAPIYARLARHCGLGAPGEGEAGLAQALVQAVLGLRALCGLPRTLAELGVDPAALPAVARAARDNASLRLNGRPVGEPDIDALYAAMR